MGYVAAQLTGAFCGAMFGFMLKGNGGTIGIIGDHYILQACVSETFVSFLFIFVILMMTEDSTAISKDVGIRAFVVASAVGSLLTYNTANVTPSMNPGVALPLYLTMIMDHGSDLLKYIWIHMIFPFVGAVISVAVFEHIYKPALHLVNTSIKEGNAINEPLLGNS